MVASHPIPNSRAVRLAGILLNRHSPAEIGEAIEIMVEVLDLIGGDTDAEEGDLEDSFVLSASAAGYDTGPGCPVSDGRDDAAYVEWETLTRRERQGPNKLVGEEDDEADDDSGQDANEDEPEGAPAHGIPYTGSGPGCPIADPGGEDDMDPGVTPDWLIDQRQMASPIDMLASMRAGMLHHRDRLRRTRCNKVGGPWVGFRLKAQNDPT